jgi:hypothetical protein
LSHVSNVKFLQRFKLFAFLLPLVILCLGFAVSAASGLIHDYSNNYFPALLLTEGIAPELVVFDIFKFNSYVWSKGYPNELTDFYLNSPFIATFFYPLALIKNAYYSKLIFNLLCILLFAVALQVFGKNHLTKTERPFLLLIPLIFFTPIRNNIEFGQLYLLVVSLTLLAYHYILVQKNYLGGSLLSLAIHIKLFPVFYCIPLIYTKKWKSVAALIVSSLALFCISIYTGGWSFWQNYLFEVLPNAIANESTVDFRSNAQSFDVFLKTLFVQDDYYNPDAVFNSVTAFKLISILLKSSVLAVAISLSFRHKEQMFQVLSIWVVALFLTQPRTATYAQILWLIPAIEVLKSDLSTKWKVAFSCLLLLVCNFPFHWFRGAPIVIEFSRLWLSIATAGIVFYAFHFRFNSRFWKGFLIILVPFLALSAQSEVSSNGSEYVLEQKNHFVIHDFGVENNRLTYQALGKKGNETIHTDIHIESFETDVCKLVNNEIYYKNTPLTNNHSIKKTPVLINGCDVYYLTDYHSRRGAFTLKKINVCP